MLNHLTCTKDCFQLHTP